MINAADTKAILRILSDALPDQGKDLLTSIQIEEGADGQLEVRVETRDIWAISRFRDLGSVQDQILKATHRSNMPFSVKEIV